MPKISLNTAIWEYVANISHFVTLMLIGGYSKFLFDINRQKLIEKNNWPKYQWLSHCSLEGGDFRTPENLRD